VEREKRATSQEEQNRKLKLENGVGGSQGGGLSDRETIGGKKKNSLWEKGKRNGEFRFLGSRSAKKKKGTGGTDLVLE